VPSLVAGDNQAAGQLELGARNASNVEVGCFCDKYPRSRW
jgi:hypothetical protein